MTAAFALARRQWAALTWLYLLGVAGALPFAALAYVLVDRRVGASLAGPDFARHFSPELFAAFFRLERESLFAAAVPAAASLLLYGLVSLFLRGALYAALARGEPARTAELFAGGGRVFGRMLRLLPLGLGFLGIALLAPAAAGVFLLRRVTDDWGTEQEVLLARLAALLVLAPLAAWTLGAVERMRLEAVARGEHRARHAFVRGLRAAVRAPARLLLAYAPYPLLALLLSAAVSLVDVELPRASLALVLAGFVLQQLVALLRAGLKLLLAASLVSYSQVNREGGPAG